jgi:hypothetical protein
MWKTKKQKSDYEIMRMKPNFQITTVVRILWEWLDSSEAAHSKSMWISSISITGCRDIVV